MPLNTVFGNFTKQNEERAFILDPSATGIDDRGNMCPLDFIGDLSICCRKNDNPYFSSITFGKELISGIIANNGKPILSFTTTKTDWDYGQPIFLTIIENGYSGYITPGRRNLLDFVEQHIYSTVEQSKIADRCLFKFDYKVGAIVHSETGQRLTGLVNLEGIQGLTLNAHENQVFFTLSDEHKNDCANGINYFERYHVNPAHAVGCIGGACPDEIGNLAIVFNGPITCCPIKEPETDRTVGVNLGVDVAVGDMCSVNTKTTYYPEAEDNCEYLPPYVPEAIPSETWLQQEPSICDDYFNLECPCCPPGSVYFYVDINSPIPNDCTPILLYDGIRIPESRLYRTSDRIGFITIDECDTHLVTFSLDCTGTIPSGLESASGAPSIPVSSINSATIPSISTSAVISTPSIPQSVNEVSTPASVASSALFTCVNYDCLNSTNSYKGLYWNIQVPNGIAVCSPIAETRVHIVKQGPCLNYCLNNVTNGKSLYLNFGDGSPLVPINMFAYANSINGSLSGALGDMSETLTHIYALTPGATKTFDVTIVEPTRQLIIDRKELTLTSKGYTTVHRFTPNSTSKTVHFPGSYAATQNINPLYPCQWRTDAAYLSVFDLTLKSNVTTDLKLNIIPKLTVKTQKLTQRNPWIHSIVLEDIVGGTLSNDINSTFTNDIPNNEQLGLVQTQIILNPGATDVSCTVKVNLKNRCTAINSHGLITYGYYAQTITFNQQYSLSYC